MNYEGIFGFNRLTDYAPLVEQTPPNTPSRLYPGSNLTIVNEVEGIKKQALNTDDMENRIENNTDITDCTVVLMDESDSLPSRPSDAPDKVDKFNQQNGVEFGKRIKSVRDKLNLSQSGSSGFTTVLFTDEPYVDVNLMMDMLNELENYVTEKGGIVETYISVGEGP
jgi:hypothetical protein